MNKNLCVHNYDLILKFGNHESPDWMSNQKTRFKFKSFTTSTTSTGEAFKHWA